MQNIAVQAAPDGKDIVTPITYDGFGRQDKNYLPYAAGGDTSGSYRSDAINPTTYTSSAQYQFYQQTTDASIPVIPNPYSQTVFEASPLNRPLQLANPGSSWAVGSGHTVNTDYEVNVASEVRLWNITTDANGNNSGATGSGYYAAGELYKTITTDENGHQVIEFKDKEGQVVCKKVQSGAAGTFVTTQYIYDDFGDLAYVLPPALSSITSFTELATDANFSNYIYAYHYDERRRMVEKKIPGKGWGYMVYDKGDRLVATQDTLQRASGYWAFTKYDALNRIAMTGRYNSSSSRAALQTTVNAWDSTKLTENRVTTGNGYTNQAFPAVVTETYSINYYDDYSFLTLTGVNPNSTLVTAPNGSDSLSNMTKGLPTGSRIEILGSPGSFLLSVSYYDSKGRVSKTIKQHQLQGVDVVTNHYDFVGELLSSTRKHYANNNYTTAAVTITDSYSYDHAGRMLVTTEQINNQAAVALASDTYNEIGQLKSKVIGGVQTVQYGYNARGWTTKIASPLFNEALHYNDPTNGATAQYNGNISSQQWGMNGSYNHDYVYSYDSLNRLVAGISDEGYNEQAISYDVMGNILSLTRPKVSATAITYNYGTKGNQLQSVSGGYVRTYSYNANGSMVSDGAITTSYNELELPKTITGTESGNTVHDTYLYDGSGGKLTKLTTTDKRNYISGIEYDSTSANHANVIDIIHNIAGVARNSSGTYSYEFFLTDHLGNTRVVFNGSGDSLQHTDYYPFGLQIARYEAVQNNYKYNGKELQPETGQYDYGARFYDPTIGRWIVQDPLSEASRRWSPYNYAYNNPTRNVDPDGMGTHDANGGITSDNAQEAQDFIKRLRDEATSAPPDIINIDTKDKEITVDKTDDDFDLVRINGTNYKKIKKGSEGAIENTFRKKGYSIWHPYAVGNSLSDAASGFLIGLSVPLVRGFLNLFKGDKKDVGGQKASDVIKYAKENGGASRPGFKGGREFANDGRGGGEVLPNSDANGNSITYKEYDVNPYQKGVNRGSERVILGSDGNAYYTPDHYATFLEVK